MFGKYWGGYLLNWKYKVSNDDIIAIENKDLLFVINNILS